MTSTVTMGAFGAAALLAVGLGAAGYAVTYAWPLALALAALSALLLITCFPQLAACALDVPAPGPYLPTPARRRAERRHMGAKELAMGVASLVAMGVAVYPASCTVGEVYGMGGARALELPIALLPCLALAALALVRVPARVERTYLDEALRGAPVVTR